MTDETISAALAVIIEELSTMKLQIAVVADTQARIETFQEGLPPILRALADQAGEGIAANRAGFALTAQVSARAHAAAMGNKKALPVDVLDDASLEAFIITMPADMVSQDRAMVEWRDTVLEAEAAELTAMLKSQYSPSPSDTPDTRVLRYRLAAVTREELLKRGVELPPPPRSTIAVDRSRVASETRSLELARVWRAGASLALFGEPELAGPLDIFTEWQERNAKLGKEAASEHLGKLHRDLGDRLAAGERPAVQSALCAATVELRGPEIEIDR